MILKPSSLEIVAKDKRVNKIGQNNSWNKYQFIWQIIHNQQNDLKIYEVVLEATLLSAKRVVYVNGNQRLSMMINFGFKKDFPISQVLNGHIQQIGLAIEFQLYVNGKSFKQLSQLQYKYQPISLPLNYGVNKEQSEYSKPKVNNKQQLERKIRKPGDQKPSSLNMNQNLENELIKKENKQENVKKQTNFKAQTYLFKQKQQQSTEDAIKNTQKQLMKILMQGKKKK